MIMIWLSFAFFSFVLELLHPTFFLFLPIMIGAVFAALAAIYFEMTVQLLFFLCGSLVSLILAIRWLHRKQVKEVKTNYELLIGKQGTVIKENNNTEFGQVAIEGQIWSYRTIQNKKIANKQMVRVIAVSGAHLIIESKAMEEHHG